MLIDKVELDFSQGFTEKGQERVVTSCNEKDFNWKPSRAAEANG